VRDRVLNQVARIDLCMKYVNLLYSTVTFGADSHLVVNLSLAVDDHRKRDRLQEAKRVAATAITQRRR
jgi:hypothetical protein